MSMPTRHRHKGEASFTLLETIIALGLLVTVILEVSSVQGRAITMTQYNRKLTQATWLANAIMAKLDWAYRNYELKELESSAKATDQEFDEAMCPKDPVNGCDYKYNVKIEEWKIPLANIVANSIGADTKAQPEAADAGDGKDAGGNPFADLIKQQLKDIFNDHVVKIAQVEVYWPEGSAKNSVSLAYLLPNQRALNTFFATLKPIAQQNQGGTGPGGKNNPPGTPPPATGPGGGQGQTPPPPGGGQTPPPPPPPHEEAP